VQSLASRQLGLGERGLDAEIAARTAGLTGYLPGQGGPITTLAREAQEADIESQSLRDQLAQQQTGLAEAEVFGFEPGREGRSTMQQRAMAQDISSQQLQDQLAQQQQGLAEAELFGFEPGREGRSTLQQRAVAQDIAASQAGIESQADRDALAEAQLFGFEPGREGRSTLQQRGLAEDIAARQAQQDLQRSEIFGGVEGEPQTIRQQALAEEIAARKDRDKLATAELYGGLEGEAQTLQQQLVENQLAGAPMDRQMMLASQAIAAREAGMDSLADAITDQVQGVAEAETRRSMEAAQERFLALGDDATFDDWFQIADEYNVPGLAEALRADFGAGKNPNDKDSETENVRRKFYQPRNGE